MAEERRGMLKTIFLAINGVLPDAIVVLFAEYARYQQLRDMPIQTDSTLCTLEKLIHRVLNNIISDHNWLLTSFT
ncbi:hypothetical protein WJX77_004397 [Trebouxia sp. C0004]